MPDTNNAAIFCNKTVRAQIRQRANEKNNVFHMADFPFGKNIPAVDNIPILVMDSNDPGLTGGIVNTEATVI